MRFLKNILLRLQTIGCYLIADPMDNSMTFSDRLYNHISSLASGNDEARIFVFRIPETGLYGFMTNPDIEEDTQWCSIQYNEKDHSIGVESLCPSVCRILYDYGCGAKSQVKLSVTAKLTNNNKMFYQINRPDAQYFRKFKKK